MADNIRMSLGKKTLVLFLVLGLAICVGSYLALRVAVLPAFGDFEHRSSRDALARVESSINAQLNALNVLNLEYSAWDETIQYIEDRNLEFQEGNLAPGYWNSIEIDFLAVFDQGGQLVYGWLLDPIDGHKLAFEGELIERMQSGHILVSHDSETNSVSGLWKTRSGLLKVASNPVLTSNLKGPVSGTVLIGQFMKDKTMADLGLHATAEITVHEMGEKALPKYVVSAFSSIRDPDSDTAVVTNSETVHGLKALRDVHGKPVAVLEVRQPRTVSKIGANTIRTTMTFFGLGSLGFVLAALFFIRKLIVSPIRDLTKKILRIRDTGDLDFEAGDARSDEVGILAGSFGDLTTGLRMAREELEAARDEALEMSKAKSEFLARMSHEIRTPMNGVLGMTELLQNTSLDDKQKRFAKTIYSSAESLLHIINDILDISKIEAGKLDLDVAPFNLRHMVEECLDLLADTAHRKGLELVGAIPDDTHTLVEGDALRLRQVIVNLLSNAVKFTEQGEIIVRVEEQIAADASILYRFEVEDTGIGIDSKSLEKIFEPFTQEDGSTTRRFGGTGLGLSICKQLLDLMGGEIGAECNTNGGCTFWFTVELERDTTAPELLKPELLDAKRVLIVDDNATNLETLRHQLKSWKMSVESASSGVEALGLFSSAAREDRPFQLVLLDMNMPEMDGVQLASAIRQTAGFNGAPLIMLSSVSAADTSDGRGGTVVDAWLTKPVRQARLYDALVSHLGRPQQKSKMLDKHQPTTEAVNDNAYRSLRILLAEDNEVNKIVAVGMLTALGHDATTAANGHEAVEILKEHVFDLVLMDCQMPVLDGFEATRSVRRWEEENDRAPTMIIALTANALSGDRERCLGAGMDDYLSKPFSLEELGSVISTNSRKGRTNAGARGQEQKARVLIVDDNAINQQVTNAMLHEFDYETDIASDGDEALDAMRNTEYDLVLMDCHMPVRNGFDTTREIRRLERQSGSDARIPVVAVTADLMQNNRQKCLDCGMDDYITKPFTEEQLRLVARRWLSDSNVDDPAIEVIIDSDGFSELSETMTLASLDRLALEEIYQLDSSPTKNTVREIVVSYCAVSTRLILQLRSAIADGDLEQIELLAHSLKGSSGQIGAVLLAALCEQILSDVRNEDLSNSVSLCERAAVEHSAVIIALDKELQRIAA